SACEKELLLSNANALIAVFGGGSLDRLLTSVIRKSQPPYTGAAAANTSGGRDAIPQEPCPPIESPVTQSLFTPNAKLRLAYDTPRSISRIPMPRCSHLPPPT